MNLRAFSKVGLNPHLFVLFLKLVGDETYFTELKKDILLYLIRQTIRNLFATLINYSLKF
nr:MAG TPA: hypothetical protein [Caudoviricetes sp.]